MPGNRPAAAIKWSLAVLGATAALVLLLAAGIVVVAGRGELAAPPLAATDCIDEKLAMIRDTDLAGVKVIGTGSSVAWRNFAAAEFGQVAGITAFNAGLCLLHVNQTVFWTDLVLDVTHSAGTVLYLVAPRDFEDCSPGDTRVFDPMLTKLYLQRIVPAWTPYAINFRWGYLMRQAREYREQRRSSSPERFVFDASGWSPPRRRKTEMPELLLDTRCYDSLRQLDQRLAARDVRLVVAALPVMPAWRNRFDPDESIVTAWIARMRSELGPHSLFIDGTRLDWADADFADPVHLMPHAGIAYSRFLAHQLGVVLSGNPHQGAGGRSL